MELSKSNNVKCFLSMGLCKGDNIKELGLQEKEVKALYPKRKFKHIPIRILSYLQFEYKYYYIYLLEPTYKAGRTF